MVACSECGRAALYLTAKNRKHRARRDHDLCLRCFRKLNEKAEREDRHERAHTQEAAHDRQTAEGS